MNADDIGTRRRGDGRTLLGAYRSDGHDEMVERPLDVETHTAKVADGHFEEGP